MVDYWFAPSDVDFTPFTDTTAAAAMHFVGQLPYSWFVKLFEINRYMLKIFTQKTQDFMHWFRSIYATLSVGRKQRDSKAKKTGISRSASKVINKPFRYLIRVRQTF